MTLMLHTTCSSPYLLMLSYADPSFWAAMALSRVFAAVALSAYTAVAQTGAQTPSVTPGDGNLLVQWNIPNADSSIASFEGVYRARIICFSFLALNKFS